MKRGRTRICAVVPAAGLGSRLGTDVPKVFVSLGKDTLLWDLLHEKLVAVAEEIVLVLSPAGLDFSRRNRASFSKRMEETKIVVQPEPRGMGDAIFGAAAELWSNYDRLLVVWGDQFNLSARTLSGIVELQAGADHPSIALPVTRMARPYVEYRFDAQDRIAEILQSREGDRCEADGFSDVGIFLLSGGALLLEEWRRHRAAAAAGAATGEINFLPFLAHLSRVAGWPVRRYEVDDAAEARGINTPEDLAFARTLVERKKR